MVNPLKSETSKNLGLLLGRLPLGAFFLLAGYTKVAKMGVKEFVEKFTPMIPTFLPKPIGQTYLYAVPFVEVLVGALLIAGFLTRTTATIMSLMLISYIIAITGAYSGDTKNITFNVVFLGLAIMLMMTGPGRVSVDGAVFKKSF